MILDRPPSTNGPHSVVRGTRAPDIRVSPGLAVEAVGPDGVTELPLPASSPQPEPGDPPPMDWYPAPDEDLLLRTAATFATGMASPVAGLRWFRDPERNDIQGELPGWPSAPPQAPHTKSDRVTQGIGRAFLTGIPLIGNLVANLGGASGSPFGDVPARSGPKGPEKPENEVHDFPVMWAAPNTLARTVPWQLDRTRRPKGYVTDLALTSRRLLFLGTRHGTGTLEKAEVLAEFASKTITGARRMPYCEAGADVRLTFTDESWVRLSTGHRNNAERLCVLLPVPSGSIDS